MQVTGAGRAAFPLRAAAALVLRRRSAAISRDACHGGRVSIMDKMRGRGSRADVLGFSSFLPVGERAFSCRLLGRWFFACGLISRGIDAPLIFHKSENGARFDVSTHFELFAKSCKAWRAAVAIVGAFSCSACESCARNGGEFLPVEKQAAGFIIQKNAPILCSASMCFRANLGERWQAPFP